MNRTDALVDALKAYDAKSAECPLSDTHTRKRIGDGPCPRCKAGPSEGCGVEALASGVFINTVRKAIADHATASTRVEELERALNGARDLLYRHIESGCADEKLRPCAPWFAEGIAAIDVALQSEPSALTHGEELKGGGDE